MGYKATTPIMELFKEYASKDLFLKVGHLHLRDIRGFAEVYSRVDLSPSEMKELADIVQQIDRKKKEERYFQ